MVREDLVASAVSFLQDPGVAGSPLDKKLAFLQSKNLTQEEIDAAFARTGEDVSTQGVAAPRSPAGVGYGYQNPQATRQPPPGFYGQPGGYWQPPPPEPPTRDWRDWFIMATVLGGVGYGLYTLGKRYVYPLIAPPTPPQLEQDKQAIDESFNKAFALLDQLASDTESLKSSEQARTERLDTALHEVESVISELKSASRRRDEEGRRISDEVRALKDLIPQALDAQKEGTNGKLTDLNTELKSLKTLVSNRMGAGSTAPRPSSGNYYGSGATPPTPASVPSNPAPSSAPHTTSGAGSVGNPTTNGASSGQVLGSSALPTSSSVPRTSSPSTFGTGSRAAIPAWQMAAANKTQPTATSEGVNGTEGTLEAQTATVGSS